MQVEIVTLFGEMIDAAASHSILSRAQENGSLLLKTVNPRDFTTDKHRTADDTPFGGGAGMVLKAEPLALAIESVSDDSVQVIYLGPDGEPFTQAIAQELSGHTHLVFVCGHYEGIDERVREGWISRTLSLGDYILTGGELAALVVLDAIVRLLPGVLGNEHSAQEESFEGSLTGLLEYPHYTRPANFRGREVPEVLFSGHHARIESWRRTQSLVRTRTRRPDLWERFLPLSKADQKLLDAYDTAIERDKNQSSGE